MTKGYLSTIQYKHTKKATLKQPKAVLINPKPPNKGTSIKIMQDIIKAVFGE